MLTILQIPIGRLTKYHLFLSRYLKLIDKNDTVLYTLMSDALNLIKKASEDVNTHIADNVAIHEIFNNSSIKKLKELYGDILKEVCTQCIRTSIKYHWFL